MRRSRIPTSEGGAATFILCLRVREPPRGWLAGPRSQDLGLDFAGTPGLPTRALGVRRPGAPARCGPRAAWSAAGPQARKRSRPRRPTCRRPPGAATPPAGAPRRWGAAGTAGARRGPGAGGCAGSAGTITSDGRCARGRAAGAAGNQRETQTRQGRSSSPSGLFTRRGWRTPRPVT